MDEMKKLIIDGQEFEVVDAAGRQRITVLENTTPSGGGLSITEKNLILQLFNKAAYAEDDAGTAYEILSNLWSGSYHSVAWEGTGYTKGNSDVAVEDGESFTSTITANAGKTIESVTVTMGGETVQGAYSSGTITIPNVTGNIVITVTTAQITVASISAVYTQSGTVYDTDALDSLKNDLVVTATFSDSSTAVIPASDYTLSGTLLEGTSTITVAYGGKTASFNVTVTHVIVETSFLTDASKWNKGSAITLANRTVDGFDASISAKGWNAWVLEGGTGANCFVKTSEVSGKTIHITFDCVINNYSDGSGIKIGAASVNVSNPTTGNNRTGYHDETFTQSGSYDFTFDVADTNIEISDSRYLAMYIYFNMNSGASVTISNLTGTYY